MKYKIQTTCTFLLKYLETTLHNGEGVSTSRIAQDFRELETKDKIHLYSLNGHNNVNMGLREDIDHLEKLGWIKKTHHQKDQYELTSTGKYFALLFESPTK